MSLLRGEGTCSTNRFLPILALFCSPYLESATEIVLEGLKEIGSLTWRVTQIRVSVMVPAINQSRPN